MRPRRFDDSVFRAQKPCRRSSLVRGVGAVLGQRVDGVVLKRAGQCHLSGQFAVRFFREHRRFGASFEVIRRFPRDLEYRKIGAEHSIRIGRATSLQIEPTHFIRPNRNLKPSTFAINHKLR